MENFCEQRGFTFHVTGSGRWGAFPFYSFEHAGTAIVQLLQEVPQGTLHELMNESEHRCLKSGSTID